MTNWEIDGTDDEFSAALRRAPLDFFAPLDPLSDDAKAGIATATNGRARQIEALTPVMRELAAKAGADGVTVADLRSVATQRGLLGASRGRGLSWLSAVPRAAGLEPTERMRRSHIAGSHGNLQRIWVSA